MDEGKQIVETVDEEGKVVKFELYDIVSYGINDYALLIPLDSKENEETIVLMRLVTENNEFIFKSIDDDEEFERVSEYIESLE